MEFEDVAHRGVQAGRALIYAAAGAALLILVSAGVEWSYLPTVRDWVACNRTMLISPSLQRRLMLNNNVTCTTAKTSRVLPCMCCVGQHCWRDATIIKNATEMGTVWDVTRDGTRYKRRIPVYAVVSYVPLASEEVYVKQEKGVALGHFLRALEVLHNLPPAGEVLIGTDEL